MTGTAPEGPDGLRRWGDLPVDLTVDGHELVVVDAGDDPLAAPFLDGDLDLLSRRPGARRRVTTAEALARGAEGAEPALVVVHTGRCGSTLLARALDASPDLLVLREPPLLARRLGLGEPRRPDVGELRAWGWWYDQLAAERGARCALKLTSTATRHAPLLAAAWPGTPVVAVLRPPEDVTASCAAAPPPWWDEVRRSHVARARLARAVAPAGPRPLSPALAAAAVWAGAVAALHEAAGRIVVIDHDELVTDPWATTAALADHVGVARPSVDAVAALARSDAKGRLGGRRPVPPLAADDAEAIDAVVAPWRRVAADLPRLGARHATMTP